MERARGSGSSEAGLALRWCLCLCLAVSVSRLFYADIRHRSDSSRMAGRRSSRREKSKAGRGLRRVEARGWCRVDGGEASFCLAVSEASQLAVFGSVRCGDVPRATTDKGGSRGSLLAILAAVQPSGTDREGAVIGRRATSGRVLQGSFCC